MKLEDQEKNNNVYHNLVEGNLILKQGLVDKRKVNYKDYEGVDKNNSILVFVLNCFDEHVQ